ncbi:MULTISPECIES: nuclear transport factor 2 family protein [Streptomyces]|uniref:nuclear transport factor 2 family protein n=1 Tax=Streptomyces TaxID=1883 RepID=UPI00167307DF|nr:nuclear transport factor 2 family protein [Streptomyces galilaeus]GGW51033.1 hypothetical protein GCM10010350_39280 [Streptomyces galilaeus]
MAQTVDTAADSAVAERIREVERARLRALVAADVVEASELHASDFQLVTPVGALLTKDEYLGAVGSGHIDYVTWEPGPIAVRVRGNAAVIRYQAVLEVVFGGHRVPSTRYWHTDTYECIEDRWQVVWSQATEIR